MEEHEIGPRRGHRCQPSKITRNTKLKGASVVNMGTVDDLQTCITHCCKKERCDIAYMEEQTCYTVECQDGLQCQTFREPAKKDDNTFIAYMQRSVDDTEKERGKSLSYLVNRISSQLLFFFFVKQCFRTVITFPTK